MYYIFQSRAEQEIGPGLSIVASKKDPDDFERVEVINAFLLTQSPSWQPCCQDNAKKKATHGFQKIKDPFFLSRLYVPFGTPRKS